MVSLSLSGHKVSGKPTNPWCQCLSSFEDAYCPIVVVVPLLWWTGSSGFAPAVTTQCQMCWHTERPTHAVSSVQRKGSLLGIWDSHLLGMMVENPVCSLVSTPCDVGAVRCPLRYWKTVFLYRLHCHVDAQNGNSEMLRNTGVCAMVSSLCVVYVLETEATNCCFISVGESEIVFGLGICNSIQTLAWIWESIILVGTHWNRWSTI